MPAGGHAILGQARQAVERRARALLMQLQELEDERVAETVDDEGAGGVEEEAAEAADLDLE